MDCWCKTVFVCGSPCSRRVIAGVSSNGVCGHIEASTLGLRPIRIKRVRPVGRNGHCEIERVRRVNTRVDKERLAANYCRASRVDSKGIPCVVVPHGDRHVTPVQKVAAHGVADHCICRVLAADSVLVHDVVDTVDFVKKWEVGVATWTGPVHDVIFRRRLRRPAHLIARAAGSCERLPLGAPARAVRLASWRGTSADAGDPARRQHGGGHAQREAPVGRRHHFVE